MASGPLLGGGNADGGDNSREKQRWAADSKVYTRKSFNKSSKSSANPEPSSSKPNPPPSSSAACDELDSSRLLVPPPATSDDASSSLNRLPPLLPQQSDNPAQPPPLLNGHGRRVTISLASRSRQEVRELRRKLTAELEQVRAFSKRLEAHELQLVAASAPTPTGYAHSQFSATDPNTPVGRKRVPEAPTPTGGGLVQRRQLSVSVAANENYTPEGVEKEKRTPKANQFYRNSEFLLGKEKFPPPEPHGHKKSKAHGGQKQSLEWSEYDGVHSAEKKLYSQAFKSCSVLLFKLMKHKHGWVFNKPVDVKALGLHDYHNIIKHPMDLGTVKSRLAKNWYKSPHEFAEDVRLTFRNAMTYNPKGQDVHIMAEQLLQIFEEQWPAIEAEFTYLPYPSVTKKPPPPLDLRTLERSDSTVHPVAIEPKTKPVNPPTHVSRAPALKKPKAKDLNKRDMTFEEKQKLSNNLQNLPPEKLENIVQIIKKKNLSLSQHDDEIEVDIDSVDVETLWELDRFVTNYKKSLSKNKRKAELAIQARQEAEQNARQMAQERNQERIVTEAPGKSKTVMSEKHATSSSPAGGEKKGNNTSRSSSSSSESGSSSSDSDSESSSGYGSDVAHSPRT